MTNIIGNICIQNEVIWTQIVPYRLLIMTKNDIEVSKKQNDIPTLEVLLIKNSLRYLLAFLAAVV